MSNDAAKNVETSASVVDRSRPRLAGRRPTLRPIPGVLCALVGLALAIGPLVSVQVEATLRSYLPAVIPVTTHGLISAGFLFVGAGVLLIALARIGGSVDQVSRETAQLEDIVVAGQGLLTTMAGLRTLTDSTQKELVALKERVSKAIEMAEDPDTKVSIFRLAASVDQLGARLEPTLKQRFSGLEAEIAHCAKNTSEVKETLGKRLEQLAARVDTRHQEGQVLVQKAFASTTQAFADVRQQLADAIQQATTKLDEAMRAEQVDSARRLTQLGEAVHKELTAHHGKLRDGLAGVSGGVHELGKQHEARVRAAEERFERGLTERATALGAELAVVKEATARGATEIGQAVGALGARIERQVRERVDELRKGLQPAIESTAVGAREVTAGLRALETSVSERLQGQQTALQLGLTQAHKRSEELFGGVKHALDATAAGTREVNTAVRALDASMGERLQGQHTALQQGLQQGLQQAHKRTEELIQGVRPAIDAAGAAARETTAAVRALETRVEERLKGQQGALQQGLQQGLQQTQKRTEELFQGVKHALDASGAGTRELTAGLRGLEARVGERVEAHQGAVAKELGQVHKRVDELAQGVEREIEAAGAGAREVTAGLRGLESRVDQRLQGQHAGVKQELDQMRERIDEMRHGLQRELDGAVASTRETGAILRGLEARIGDQIGEQLQVRNESVRRELDQVRVATERASHELTVALGELRERLDESLERRFARFESELVSIAELAGEAAASDQDMEMLEAGESAASAHHRSAPPHSIDAMHVVGEPAPALPTDTDEESYQWAAEISAPEASDEEPRAALPTQPIDPSTGSAHYLAGGDVADGWNGSGGDQQWHDSHGDDRHHGDGRA